MTTESTALAGNQTELTGTQLITLDPDNYRRGARNPSWKGGRILRTDGYMLVRAPEHSRAHNGYVLEHIVIAEIALGKPLPPKAVVHHVDERQGRIDAQALVICPDDEYHRLLHQRSRALRACDCAGWRKCTFCKCYSDPATMYVRGPVAYHYPCKAQWRLARKTTRRVLRQEVHP